jgi:hypothetical protein
MGIDEIVSVSNASTAITIEQFREFAAAVIGCLPYGIKPSTLEWWINNRGSLSMALYEALMPDRQFYTIFVNYGRSVEDGIKAGGYDWVSPDITSANFPTARQEKADVRVGAELIHFNRHISTAQVLLELKEMGCRPANIHELLALGEQYPWVQRKFFLVVALGSVWEDCLGYNCVPALSESGSRCILRLLRFCSIEYKEHEWLSTSSFLAVPCSTEV